MKPTNVQTALDENAKHSFLEIDRCEYVRGKVGEEKKKVDTWRRYPSYLINISKGILYIKVSNQNRSKHMAIESNTTRNLTSNSRYTTMGYNISPKPKRVRKIQAQKIN